jgi:hypothetical protein
MLKLDNNLLAELGLGGLPEEQKKAMLQHIYETLELRVGTQLANQMTDQQLEEFERFIDAGGNQNQAQALQWLESNLPNYKQVVSDVFEALKGEIKAMAPQLVATAQQTAVMQPQGPTQVNAQPYQQPQVAQVPASPQAQSYTPVEPTEQEQKTMQLHLDNGYKDVAMVVDATGQRLLRARAPLDTEPTYKLL